MNRGRLFALILLVVVLLFSSACATPQAAPQQPTEEVAAGIVRALDQYLPAVALPRLEVTYDSNGVPSVFGIRTTTIQSLVGVDLSFLNLPPAWVNGFSARNLQHIEVEVHQEGVFLYANGRALPYLAWDEGSLDMVGQLLLSTNAVQLSPVVQEAFPLVRRLGVDLVLHFPRAEGAQAIAVRPREARAVVAGAGPEPATALQLNVQYTSEGLPSVVGLTSRDLLPLGIDLRFMELPEPTLAALDSANLESVQLVTQSDGIVLLVNGQALPRLAYSQEHLTNTVDLYAQLYGENFFTRFARNLVPLVEATNVDVTVHMPASVHAD